MVNLCGVVCNIAVLIHERSIAYGASVNIQSLMLAGSLNKNLNGHLVAKCGNRNLIGVTLSCVADRIAVLVNAVALVVAIVVVTSFGAGRSLALNCYEMMAKCRNLSTDLGKNEAILSLSVLGCRLGHNPSISIAGVTSYFAGCILCVANLSSNARNVVSLYVVPLIIGNSGAAKGLIADCAVNNVSNAVNLCVIIIFVKVGLLAFLDNLHCALMSIIQAIKSLARKNVVAISANLVCFLACASRNSSISFAYQIAVLIKSDCTVVDCLNMSSSYCRCCNCFAVLVNDLLSYCGESLGVLVTIIGHCKQCLNRCYIFFLCISRKKCYSCCCICNVYRLAANFALCITPAVLIAGGLYNDSKCVVMAKCSLALCCNTVDLLTASSAVSNSQACLGAGCFLNYNSYGISASSAVIPPRDERSDIATYNFATIFANLSSDARLLCSSILFDNYLRYVLVVAGVGISQSNCRNQRNDHENSHQHAQQSLFHFLLFTSVKIVG